MEAFSAVEDIVDSGRAEADRPCADLAELYDQHARAVYRLLLAMLRSPEDAQDALSEVFLKVARRKVRRIRKPRAYLLAGARRQAISMLRRRRRETPTDPADERFFDTHNLKPPQAPLAQRIEAAMRELPAEQREVIVLKVYEGFTFAQIAAITRVRPNTVASRYRYAVEKLRLALKELSP